MGDPMNGSPGVLTLNCSSGFPTWALVPMAVSAPKVLLLIVVMACIRLSDSPILGPVVFIVSFPLLWIQEELIFQVCSGFYLLLGCSGHFQAFYMQNWKPEVSCSLFN